MAEFTVDQNQRRYDLDWLRIGAFTLLIFYHIGMFYVPWSWHVKSIHAPVDAARIPMLLVNPWRLSLLFFVSGVAVRFAIDQTQSGKFLFNRTYRLLIPLLFGMWVICAPQAYFELVQKGQFSGTLWEFYKGYAAMPWASPQGWSIITPTWNHLWYLLYVLIFTLILGLASLLSKGCFSITLDRFTEWALKFPTVSLVFALPALLIFIRYVLASSYGAQQTLWGDWHNLTASFLTMVLGYAIAKNKSFWDYLKSMRWVFLMVAVLVSTLVVVNVEKEIFDPVTRAVVRIVNCWSVIYAILGFGQTLLNKDSAILRYLTVAIFPYYILHQTIIIGIGVPLTGLGYSLLVELMILILATVVGCAVLHHFIIRHMGRWGVLLGWFPKINRSK